ncbi:uncharacterized protein FRV6_15348 [Fusarium oxysporum]|uniref:Uncharacterized protein n=1 Tax=Fusarium oxysporum TaxID=5507 RepID=A0A2H3U2L6_FUSOX|nr:uncharacterized protein FRV6_15348 [Fusarium oxysporum]
MSTFELDDEEHHLTTAVRKLLRRKDAHPTAGFSHRRAVSAPQLPQQDIARQQTARHQQFSNELDRLVYDALTDTRTTEEFLAWIELSNATPKQVLMSLDDFLYKNNKAAWEVMSYIIRPDDKPETIVKKYKDLHCYMIALARLLSGTDVSTAPPSLHSLWRVWAYCIISVHALVEGRSIADQTVWLRGTKHTGHQWIAVQKQESQWKLKPENGIFAQSNAGQDHVQRIQDVETMVDTWHRLSTRWIEAILGKGYKTVAAEDKLMYILARETGPIDLIQVLNRNEPSLHRLSFRNATTQFLQEGNHSEAKRPSLQYTDRAFQRLNMPAD